MERKAKITQEAVNDACIKLSENGKNPTVNAVIGLIGGSFSTVGIMLKSWKEQQTAQSIAIIEMPETVTEAVKKAAADIWGAASQLASEMIERIEKETGEVVNKALDELAEYTGEVTRLENELEQAEKQVAQQEEKTNKTQQQLSKLTAENTALETRLSDRDSELVELKENYKALQKEMIEIAKATSKLKTEKVIKE